MREITYHKAGDCFIPDLYLAEHEYEKGYHIGKYGHLRLEYLKRDKKADYTIMFMDGTLRKHIEWVSLMNNYKHCAEEIIYSELIYC